MIEIEDKQIDEFQQLYRTAVDEVNISCMIKTYTQFN
jgi:hypothetical protein